MVEVVELVFPLLGVVLLGGGVGLIRKGRFYVEQSERIAETGVTDVGSLQRGTAAVQGTARVLEEAGTVTTELTGEEALVSRSRVSTVDETRDHDGDDVEMRSHSVVHEAEQSVPFLVEDDTGTVRVDPPEEADVRLEENVETVRSGDGPTVADLAEDPDAAVTGTVSVGDTRELRDYRRRYEQAAIVPGEAVYVLGEAVDRADWDGESYELTGGENPRRFVVSDLSREEVRSGGKIGAYLAYAFGGVLGFLGALMLFGGLAAVLG